MGMNIEARKGIAQRSSLITNYSFFAAALIAVTIASVLCAEGKYREAVGAGLVTLAVGYILSARVSIESVLIFWFATAPLASFYVRFPLDKSIITYNRAIIVLIVAMLILKPRTEERKEHPGLRLSVTKFELAWALLSVLALASAVLQSNDVTYATKLAIDSFFLPLLCSISRDIASMRE